ncbi:MAG: hypothetical protein ACK4Q5_16250 [Saprospiraceae bacterium]
MKNLCLATLSILFFSGCDCVYNYRFEVTNRLPEPIEIRLMEPRRDTTFFVATDSTSIVFEDEGGIEGAHGPHRREDEDILFSLTISRADGTVAKTNFGAAATWQFREENSVGVSAVEIDSLDF